MPRCSSSVSVNRQRGSGTVFQLPFSHVSFPNPPGCGTAWNSQIFARRERTRAGSEQDARRRGSGIDVLFRRGPILAPTKTFLIDDGDSGKAIDIHFLLACPESSGRASVIGIDATSFRRGENIAGCPIAPSPGQ